MDELIELLPIVSDTAAGATQCKRGTNDEGEGPDLAGNRLSVDLAMSDSGARHIKSDALHSAFEELAIFSFGNRRSIGTDQLYPVPSERSAPVLLHRGVERSLAADGWQKRVRSFLGDDQLNNFGSNRLNVGTGRKLRISHDRGRIGIYQDNLIALFLQSFAGLDSGIVKFAALPDNNRSGPNHQNFFKILVFFPTS